MISGFVDLDKALDAVEHKGLLYNLEKVGERGTALRLMQTYLQGK